MAAKQLLSLSGVSKEFPGVKALDNVSFDLNEAKYTPSSAKTVPANPL